MPQTPLFDMSKATPINPPAPPAGTPLFDMSKARPIGTPAPPVADKPSLLEGPGVLRAVGRVGKGLLYDMPKAVYGAATTPPQNDEEQAIESAGEAQPTVSGPWAVALC